MSSRWERRLLVGAPVVAIGVVAMGLRLGAPSATRAAVVYGAPASRAGTGLAWQLVAFDEESGVRAPVALPDVEVTAWQGDAEARWRGATNEDGAAEVGLPFATAPTRLEVRAGRTLLAAGNVRGPASVARTVPASSWAGFSRREGEVVLDVAVLGERVATGFPASLWVRATDASTRAPLPAVRIEAERDSSFVPSAAAVTTDARGWAHLVATPVGHAVSVVLHARTDGGCSGVWAGGLYVSPGAAQLALEERTAPGQSPVIEVVVPTLRKVAYIEVDDALGRAWATAVPVQGTEEGMPSVTVKAPPLAPGLYWAVEAGAPSGASELGPGSVARPFFVAESDAAALAFGTDAEACAPPADPRDMGRVVSLCLALAGATPMPHWTALEGFTLQHARDAEKRARGLGLGLGAIVVTVLLEALLLLKSAFASRTRLRAAEAGREDEGGGGASRLVGPGWTVGIAILVAMMGLLLLAAFLARLG